ncbi:hypothetical protein K0M31_002232 [Melipona bicolor]|uniref:Uncharacterized protein n=1 Tax=Melipona bicolor TaxID=60889 RepID=A0AA40FJU7_9HYME|nr:hypothetical protein K0M31_012868 [Melipona bicolor]KAK1137738.1 hypothetical protein K0M31_002232 [Melipona bicolor]
MLNKTHEEGHYKVLGLPHVVVVIVVVSTTTRGELTGMTAVVSVRLLNKYSRR